MALKSDVVVTVSAMSGKAFKHAGSRFRVGNNKWYGVITHKF